MCLLRWLLLTGLLLTVSLSHAEPSSGVYAPTQNNSESVATTPQYHSVFSQYQLFNEQPLLSWREANDVVGKIGGWRFYLKEARQPDPAGKSTELNSVIDKKQPVIPSINPGTNSGHGVKP